MEDLRGPLDEVPTVIVPPGDVADVRALVDILGRHRVSRLWVVPTLLRTLLEDVPDVGTRLPRLRLVVASGRGPTSAHVRPVPAAVATQPAGQPVRHHRGLGRDLVGPRPRRTARGTETIGRPLDNVRVYVLDERGGLCPPGWPGQLHVAGAGLALRSLGSAPPFLERSVAGRWERLYPTGDWAVLGPDLELELLGRRDGQLKVRGVRIEPAEIEAALYRHPAVAGCAVAMTQAPFPRLVAWVEQAATRATVSTRAHLRAVLPLALLPQQIVLVERLPTTTSGKIDRLRLPSPPPPETTGDAPDAPPGTTWSSGWRRAGPLCWGPRSAAATPTSSPTWAGTPSSPSVRCRGSGTTSRSICHCG